MVDFIFNNIGWIELMALPILGYIAKKYIEKTVSKKIEIYKSELRIKEERVKSSIQVKEYQEKIKYQNKVDALKKMSKAIYIYGSAEFICSFLKHMKVEMIQTLDTPKKNWFKKYARGL